MVANTTAQASPPTTYGSGRSNMVPVSLVWVICCQFVFIPLSQYLIEMDLGWLVPSEPSAFGLDPVITGVLPPDGGGATQRVRLGHSYSTSTGS